MSMQDLLDGLVLVGRHPEKAFFVGPRSEELVKKAEQELGMMFPATYRAFLLALGAGNFGSAEFYCVIDDDFESSSVPDGIWYTLAERKAFQLPSSLLVIGLTSYGERYCIDTAINADGPVVVYQPLGLIKNQNPEITAEDFGAFFLGEIKARLSL